MNIIGIFLIINSFLSFFQRFFEEKIFTSEHSGFSLQKNHIEHRVVIFYPMEIDPFFTVFEV